MESKLSMICALGKNRAIGNNNSLLWNIPDDLKRFKEITTGHPVIMGRKTYESIGRALPNRTNIIVTRDSSFKALNCQICNSLEEAISLASQREKEEIFIIGGGEIYKEAIELADKLYLTVVNDDPKADAFFPEYERFKNILYEEEYNKGGLVYKFLDLER